VSNGSRRGSKLLQEEKEHTRRADELAQKRQELPWVRVEKGYRFDTDDGSALLSDLFRYSASLSKALQNRPPWCGEHVWREPFNRVTSVQEQSGARLLAILSAERTQVRGIGKSRTRG
jgi:hypothetical protein